MKGYTIHREKLPPAAFLYVVEKTLQGFWEERGCASYRPIRPVAGQGVARNDGFRTGVRTDFRIGLEGTAGPQQNIDTAGTFQYNRNNDERSRTACFLPGTGRERPTEPGKNESWIRTRRERILDTEPGKNGSWIRNRGNGHGSDAF